MSINEFVLRGSPSLRMAFFFQECDKWLDKVESSIDLTSELCNWFQDKCCLLDKLSCNLTRELREKYFIKKLDLC